MRYSDRLGDDIKGSSFVKLLGTGGGFGFSAWPDFGTYALLCVWQDREEAKAWSSHPIYHRFAAKSNKTKTFWMSCIQSHGSWGGQNPFITSNKQVDGPIMVITRARINVNRLWRFWKNVPQTVKGLKNTPGLKFSKGIGQVPFIEQATFSLWEDAARMKAFAYTAEHREVISKVKKENWYKEELFARFVPVEMGTTDGNGPLSRIKF
jgi:heme-degrading monooxygenase HmoA